MKLKQSFLFAAAFSLVVISSATQARVLFQAGDIADGERHEITKNTGPASYYKIGVQGEVTFKCDLQGEGVKALMYPGKNFTGNFPAWLSPGLNGPYTYKLRALGASNGNIKVQLMTGEKAFIQCKAI